MPFTDGETLREKLNRETQLGIEEAVSITTAIADALNYAHGENVIRHPLGWSIGYDTGVSAWRDESLRGSRPLHKPSLLSDPRSRIGVDRIVVRTLRALGDEATLGDLFVLTGLSSTDIERSLERLMATGAGGVRVSSAGDLTYHLEAASSGSTNPIPSCTEPVQWRSGAGLKLEPMIGFDYKTLTLIRARRGVLSLAELVEHTGLTVFDAEAEMLHLARSYGGESVLSLDGHLVWVFPRLMTSVHGRFMIREPRPAWARRRAPLRRPGAGRTRPRSALLARIRAFLHSSWRKSFGRVTSQRDLRRQAIGYVFRVALKGRGVVSLGGTFAFLRARAGGCWVLRSRTKGVLEGLAVEFDAPVTVEGGDVFFGFRNVKRQFLASEIVRGQVDPARITGGRIVFDSMDTPTAAHRRDLELFDEWLAWEGSHPSSPTGHHSAGPYRSSPAHPSK